ncbi:MAG: 50S ribosomal protein L21 [Proteobacteria bacterium]|nr:50S ribosomal protein L21 [Pseudomonadota bacterium]
MYAIVKCGGKQIKVQAGDILRVERMESTPGEVVTLDQVLLVGEGDKVTVGTPLVSGAKVSAAVIDQIRDKKVIIFKKKRRQNYRRKKGHRQFLTVLHVTEIAAGGKTAKSERKVEVKAAAAKPAKAAAAKAAKPAAAKAAAPAKKAAAAEKTTATAKKPAAKKAAAKKA